MSIATIWEARDENSVEIRLQRHALADVRKVLADIRFWIDAEKAHVSRKAAVSADLIVVDAE